MPVSIEPKPKERRIEVTMRPHATPADRHRAVFDLAELLADHPGFGALVDVRAPTELLTADDARQIIGAVLAHAAAFDGGIALIAKPGVTYGLARIEQAIGDANGVAIEVFTDRASAVGWLAGRRVR